MKYSGCIIEESLKDKSVLNQFEITQTIIDDGTMYIVEIDEEKLVKVLPELQKSLTDDGKWYADLKCDDYHYIIFNDKLFKVNRDFGEQYETVKAYGIKKGIPEEKLPDSSWAKNKN